MSYGRTMRCVGSVVHGTRVHIEGRNYLVPMTGTYRSMYRPEGITPTGFKYDVERYQARQIMIPMVGQGLPFRYSEEILVPDWMSPASAAQGLKALGLLYMEEK